MDDEELDLLAGQAAVLLGERHAGALRSSETIAVRLTRVHGTRRVELSVADSVAETLLELFADVPDLADEEAIPLGLDFLDGVLSEHLASDREALPLLDPATYRFEGHAVYLSGGLRRPALEAAADALLADRGSGDEG